MQRDNGWNDKELEAKVDAKLKPILDELESACEELGMSGIFFGQQGRMHLKDGPKGEKIGGYRMMAHHVNMEVFEEGIEKVANREKGDGDNLPDSEQGFQQLLADNDLPGPLLMVLLLLQVGRINPEKLLVEAVFRSAMASALESDDFGSMEAFMRKMQQQGIVIPGPTRQAKKQEGWEAKHDEDGNFIGFVNPETGEEDLLN